VGTYEHAVIAWRADLNEENQLELKMIFAQPSHLGYVTCLASNSKWLVSGSTDEAIKVYDHVNLKEVGTLMKHTDKITCLQLFSNTHLLSGAADGQMCIWRTKDWECIRACKAHKDIINSISVHPSGKLALTCSKDRTLRIWNLSNVRSAYDEKLNFEPEILMWSPSGSNYAITAFSSIRVYTSAGKLLHKYDQPRYEHILTLVFLKEDVIASGGEDRKITIWNTQNGNILHTIGGFTNRIKALGLASKNTSEEQEYDKYLISMSSDGFIRVWDLDTSTEEPSTQVSVPSRLTALTVTDNNKPTPTEPNNDEEE